MLWFDWLRTALATMHYPAAWTLPPRLVSSMRESLRRLRPVFSPVGIVLHPYAPPIGGPAFGRYLRGLGRMAHGERIPLVVHLSVTDRCGNACPRCSNLPCAPQDPPLANLIALIGRLRRAGTVSIALTGGEPMLRLDLSEIVAACAPDISVTLFTTGLGLDSAIARRLREAGLDMAFISLDHDRAEVHDRQRGTEGVHRQAVQAIQACRDAGLFTAAQAVAGEERLADGAFDRYLDFCRDLGVHEVMLLEPVAVRPGGTCAAVSSQTRARLKDLHAESSRDGRTPRISSSSFLESPEFLGCQAGFSFLYLNAAGEVFPCDFAPITLGNVYRDDLAAILRRAADFCPAPTCHCLAERISRSCGPDTRRPLSLGQAAGIPGGREDEALPRLMQWLKKKKTPDE